MLGSAPSCDVENDWQKMTEKADIIKSKRQLRSCRRNTLHYPSNPPPLPSMATFHFHDLVGEAEISVGYARKFFGLFLFFIIQKSLY